MKDIADRVSDVEKISSRPAMAPANHGAVSLAMGEPDFPTPKAVVNVAVQALRDGHTHYADQHGIGPLREAVAEKLTMASSRPWNGSEVLMTHGATAGLAATCLALINPGDKVVIPEPAYSLYADLVTLAGGKVTFVPLNPQMHWDMDQLRDALRGAKMFIFSNPSNPTGAVHTKSEIEKLEEILEPSDTLVLADEAYSSLVYPGIEYFSTLASNSLRDRLVYTQTFSKTYAMTGWRIGYVAAEAPLINAIARVHRTINGSLNTAVQEAALEALEIPAAELATRLATYEERSQMVIAGLSEVAGLTVIDPEGAFYAFIKYDSGQPSHEVVRDLAERGVLVRAGSEYGPSGEGHFRISFATSKDNLERGLQTVAEYFNSRA